MTVQNSTSAIFPTSPLIRRKKLTNLAFKKPTRASSEWNNDWRASNANDGNVDTYWSPKYPKDTPSDELSWWQVDLGNIYQLVRVELMTRPGLPLARYNFEIQASNDEEMDEYIVLGRVGSCDIIPDYGTLVLDFAAPVSCRYLRATKIVKERSIEVDFAIAEFRAIGY